MFTINSIEWPQDPHKAIQLYLGYTLEVIDALNINFLECNHNPIPITQSYLDGKISDNIRAEALDKWWSYIDSQEAIREFKNKEVLMGRLAICLLSVNEKNFENGELGENLSWFLEVLGFLDLDTHKAIRIMEEYFSKKLGL